MPEPIFANKREETVVAFPTTPKYVILLIILADILTVVTAVRVKH